MSLRLSSSRNLCRCRTARNRSRLIEYKIYQRLGQHPRITKFLGVYNGMLVLERLQCPLRQRLLDLRKQTSCQSPRTCCVGQYKSQKDCDTYISRGVWQVDIGLTNVLLDWGDDAKLSDFAGSSLDGSEPTVFPSFHSEHPRWPSER